jgi:glycosyltransferase involved in cell wall biosynthesis
MAFISVITGCFNEEENIRELYTRICAVFETQLVDHSFELIVIDNASTDRTVEVLRQIAGSDPRVRVIVNNRNFGHIRSGYHAFLQASGDAVVAMVSDLQDPPELIPRFIEAWQRGFKVVLAQKNKSEESWLFFSLRKMFYRFLQAVSDVELVENATGFGLYDRMVVADIARISDPYPYFRGLICELGYPRALIPFTQPTRKRGVTKNNFYTLWDIGMLGIISHSKMPLRLATFFGVTVALISFLFALIYGFYKVLFWDSFQVGMAPLIIGMFFLGAVQLVFIGVVGEYVGAIYTQVLRRPPVVERERINF